MAKYSEERYCVADLKKERKNCPFVQKELTEFLDGGSHMTKLRKKLEDYFLNDPDFLEDNNVDYLGHKDLYNKELRKAIALISKLSDDENLQKLTGNVEGFRMLISSKLGPVIMKDGNPITLHFVMFLPAILGHGDLEQKAHWLAQAWNGTLIGTYAQTELGHGTFLRGLETTATYDPQTEEFVLHSPTITAYKWWPGGLGKTANCAIVMAQLHSKGRCHGPHPFIVRLRDLETHASLPGIVLGEIGPRLGLNTNDNGFLGFKNHRIPRRNMLMQHAQVLKDGTYVKPQNEKLVYGTMIFVRVIICYDVCRQLQRAVTIATRYSAVRRQSEMVPGQPEPQILDYQTQQHKVFPQLAAVFAMTFAADYLWDAYNEYSGHMLEGDLDLLPELHAMSCGLKAQSTTDSTEGVNTLRLSCGGHGFMASSNLPRIWGATTAAQTYEGENTVLWLQVARYIIKCVNQSVFPEGSSLFYLSPSRRADFLDVSDISNQGLLNKWQEAVRFLVVHASERLQSLCRAGKSPEIAWNETAVDLVTCAQAHMRFFTCYRNINDLETHQHLSPGSRLLLQRLCRLYVLHHFLLNQGHFLRCGAVTEDLLRLLEGEMYALLSEVRPVAVSVVDSFDIDDRILQSTLGAWDGDVYARLFDEAMKNPLNDTDVSEGFEKYLKPYIQSKL